jgi:ribosomal protein S18 acetylase RimI-like enzyme
MGRVADRRDPGAGASGRALTVAVRDLARADLPALVRLDREHRADALRRWLAAARGGPAFGLGAETGGTLAGFLFGEVRAFEFGSPACGWVFAVGVDPAMERRGIASALLGEARRRFSLAGAASVRTMVRRDDLSLLSFFRSRGFVGGRYVQLELDSEEAP